MAKAGEVKQLDDAPEATRKQVAAVPVRTQDGVVEVCLVTTRETRRWSVPKGWPMRGRKAHRAAAIEAEEEAGLLGKVGKRPLGTYLYWKRLGQEFALVEVTAYRLDVTGARSDWPEREEREVRWIAAAEAARLVEEPGLSGLLQALADGEDTVPVAAAG